MLLLIAGIALSMPNVQTKLAHYFVEKLNEKYKIDINVEAVSVSIFGGVKLKKVLIKDFKNDTLIYSNRINTNILDVNSLIGINRLADGDLFFGDVRLDGLLFNLKYYKGEKDSNLDKFIAAFDDGSPPSKKPFLLKADNVYFTDSRFILTDENRENQPDLDLTQLNTKFANLKILGSNVDVDIQKMSFLHHYGLFVENLATKFSFTNKNMKLKDLELVTKESAFKGDIVMSYDKNKNDLADFNNKVQFDVKIDSASIASNDVHYFYKELGKDQQFKIKTKLNGTMNDLYFTDLNLSDEKNTQIIGNINFKNLLGDEKKGETFYMNGDFDKISSNYANLSSILPNLLGKKLPTSLKKLGQFDLKGTTEITTKTMLADVFMTTALGKVETNMEMSNIDNIDNANYSGNVKLDNFDIGTFLNRNDVGRITLETDVDGKGFTQKYLKTNFSGRIANIRYNNYDYTNVVVNGKFKKPYFEGKVTVRDPNLSMDFDGTVDLSKKMNRYIFDTKIDFVDLNKLHFIKDSVSKFVGNVKINVVGSTIDNFVGSINIEKSSYQNTKNTYNFDDFEMKSSFDESNVRTLSINSPDIIEGQIVGKFKFAQLPKMLENSIGSLYTNYKPNPVAKGQFLKFDFSIYNKIIEIFYPGIEIATNTKINGSINSDDNEFKFKFNSPQIAAFNNYFDNLRIEVDNKNPLFNTYVELDSVRTKNYKISEFSLINITQNDTLFLRSEFKGGKKGEDNFNFDLFHTINNDNKNVVGIKKSEVKFKENLWYLNEKNGKDNTITFDKKLTDFNVDNIIMSHENQFISLDGNLQNKTDKDLKLNFNQVDLTKITPSMESFKFDGILDGDIHILQKNNVYQPTADVKIDLLKINNIELGNLNLDVSGDDSLSKFIVSSSLDNKNLQAFSANGNVSILDKKTNLDLDLNFNKFNLGILSSIGGSVITDIRGFASGTAKITGETSNPDYSGRLYLDESGLNIPYLNVNYGFENNTVIDVTKTKFTIQNANIFDTKYSTTGILRGYIGHKNFDDWKLALNLTSDNILALDTDYTEESLYYGKAFILGDCTISGPVSGLTIDVEAKSNKGTDMKIPVNNSESVGEKNYIHFVTAKEKNNVKTGIVETAKPYNGLELNFDLDVTPDANIEIIIDKNSGHKMQGNGYGTLKMSINTLGKFNMTGNFEIIEGKYDFKYGGIINKTFDVKKFGTVVWTGDPMKADLNLEAVYKTSANPGLLLENASFNKKVPVNVTIGIKGNLSSPEPDFNIDFPTVNSILKSEIQTKLDDKDTRQKQALVLLSTGSFLSAEGVNQTMAYNNLYEKASSLLDDLFEDKDSKIKFGVGYNGADKTLVGQANTGGRVDVNFSTQLSERISINGGLAVPVGGVTETAIIGNVEVMYRVNEDGTLNLRVFNRENEINYIGEGIGYTQGGGISYEVDFDTFKELISKINFFKKKANNTKYKNSDFEIPDSDLKPINPTFDSKKKKPAKNEQKANQEAVPTDEN